MPDVINVFCWFYPVFVPLWIALHGEIPPRRKSRGEYEASFEQKETEKTKLCFLRFLLFKTCFCVMGVSLFERSRGKVSGCGRPLLTSFEAVFLRNRTCPRSSTRSIVSRFCCEIGSDRGAEMSQTPASCHQMAVFTPD